MEPAVFLVTALADVKKDSFGTKLHELLDQAIPVRIIFANLNFVERVNFDQLLATLIVGHEQSVSVASLYDIFCHDDGVPLGATALTRVAHAGLTTQRHTHQDGRYYVRYLQNDQLLEESHYSADGHLFYQNFYTDNQLVQAVYYGRQARPETISNFQAGALKETLLLNADGALLYRFLQTERPVQRLFNMDNTSNLQLMSLEAAQPQLPRSKRARAEKRNTLTVVNAPELSFDVVDYVHAGHFDGIYDFYRYALQRLDYRHQRLYINVEHNVALSTALPNQLIFNY